MNEVVNYEVSEKIATLTVDNPPVNAVSHAVRKGISQAISRAEQDESVRVIVLRAAGKTFPAGADVTEFGRPRQKPILSDVCLKIENCSKPVIAEVQGMALGGGFELALACHFRLVAADSKMGLPEINLGVLPGGGGTQRVPRIVGAEVALNMMLTGKPMSAENAEKYGLIDKCVRKNLPAAARKTALNFVENGVGPRPTRARNEGLKDPAGFAKQIAEAREKYAARPTENYAKIIDCVEAAQLLPFENGIALERQSFDECENSDHAAALRHAFFAERRAAKIPELKGAELRPVETIAVVGAGTMGAGIAIACLDAGFPVTLVERNDEGLAAGVDKIKVNYQRSAERGRISEAQGEERMQRLTGTIDMSDLAEIDLVIEAVFEDDAVKRGVFAQLDAVMKPGAILATNTSYLDIDELAATISRPQDVVGYHFFSPAHIMKLLEVVVGAKTDPNVVATGFALAKKLRKVPVRAGVADGFIGNRILAAYRLAADFMLEDGATPAQIDGAMRAFGFPIGPYQVLDMAGLDISWARRKRLAATRDPQDRYVSIGDRICEQGWFGQKAGRGYYIHDQGGRPVENPDVLAIIEAARAEKGIEPRGFSDAEIQDRCLNAMANEGARLLEEGIALRPSDIDVVLLFGYGFPRHRGGPMMTADQKGLLAVKKKLETYVPEEARFWAPSPMFGELSKNGQTFADLNDA